MNCPSCNEINPEDSIFCGNCGNSLESDLICPECGEANPQDSIYCAECGSLYKPSLEVPAQITIGEPENINLNTNRSQRSLLIIGGIIVAMVVVVFTLTLRPTEIDKAEVIKEVPIQIEVIREVEVIKEVPVEVEVIREVEVTKEVPVEVEVIREVEVVKEIPVENLNADIDKEAETKEKHQRYSISSNTTRPLSQTYHDYEIGFSISYPEQWDLVEQNERDVPEWVIPDIELRNPHGGFIRIEGQKMEGVTLRNFTSDRITNDRNFVAETTEHIEKIPADLTTGIYSRSDEPAQILTAVIDPWVLSIVFINESSSKDEQSTTFMEIIESMEIR
tara:strand:- start:71 stop:1072 length:1002 start_codon:yes stop_codon:yes gene_type:complete